MERRKQKIPLRRGKTKEKPKAKSADSMPMVNASTTSIADSSTQKSAPSSGKTVTAR